MNRVNSTEENRAKRGGAEKGHKGVGRKDFKPEEADAIRYNNAPPGQHCRDTPSLRQTGTEYHAVYNFKPMELERVMNINAQFRKKAYAWIFVNNAFKVFLFRDSRGSKVPEEVLGNEKLMLILITDRYRGYITLLVERQLCFVHILRDVEKLKLEFPDDKQIAVFCENLIPNLSAAITLRTMGLKPDEYLKSPEHAYFRAERRFNPTSAH